MAKSRKMPPLPPKAAKITDKGGAPAPAPKSTSSTTSTSSTAAALPRNGVSAQRLDLTRQCIRRVMHDVGFVAWQDLPDAGDEAAEWLRIVDSGAKDAVSQIAKRLKALMAEHIQDKEQLERFPCDQVADAYVCDIGEVKDLP